MAIGEIGLDYKYTDIWDKQPMIFDRMLNLAENLDLPVIIHSRGTTAHIVEMFPSYNLSRVLLQWFSRPISALAKVVEHGYFITEGAPTVYSKGIREVVKLDENVCVRRVRKNEIKDLLRKIPAPWYYEALMVELSSIKFIIEEKQKIEKGLPYKHTSESVGKILLALRLLKRADVDSPCSFLLAKEEDLVANFGMDLAKTGYSKNPYFLKKSEIPDFVRLWNNLKELDAKPHLHFALHEFLSAFEIYIIEEKIYHYVVALESLVFYSIDKTFPNKGILIGLAIGMLLGTNQKERVEIRRTIKNAYEIRNGVAHGLLKKLRKHLKDSKEISHRVEDYLRNVLRRLICEESS